MACGVNPAMQDTRFFCVNNEPSGFMCCVVQKRKGQVSKMEAKSNQFLGTEKIGKLMSRYAVPCIISLLVGALYNIDDQIFIANASDFPKAADYDFWCRK